MKEWKPPQLRYPHCRLRTTRYGFIGFARSDHETADIKLLPQN
jgi:hypothetical protein